MGDAVTEPLYYKDTVELLATGEEATVIDFCPFDGTYGVRTRDGQETYRKRPELRLLRHQPRGWAPKH